MAANPMNNKNLGRTHSKELAKNNRGKRTRKNSDYQTAATAARQAQAQQQAQRQYDTRQGFHPLHRLETSLFYCCPGIL